MHHQPRTRPADGCDKSRVAIIGTGLAGLTTAYLLHQDKQKRYEVTLFEQAPKFSLDAASVTLRNEATGALERVDIPPRSFCAGYYANLCRMYDHLGISFQRIQLIWVFAKVSSAAQAQIPSAEAAQTMPGSYFVYGKRLHELLLVSPHFWLRGSLQNMLLTFYLAVCHAWFFAACFFFPPRMIHPERYLDVKGSAKSGQNCESFRQYLDRIWLPQYYVLYFLLPILSIICSCSHAEMLDFPASDVTSFMKGSFLRKTYVAKGGINRVQATLAEGIQDVRLQTRVNKVERVDGGVLIRYESTQDERRSAEEVFDRVVLAVSPNVAAAIFNPSKPLLSVIPTVPVTSTVLASLNTKISLVNEKTHVPSGECSYRRGEAQIMAFRTTYSDSIVQTESLHYLEGGLVVRTSPSGDVPEVKGTLDKSRFTRTLRTTESRNMVRKAMGASDGVGWVNGKDDVWIVGSWCWDGMVLLEGCVVSAMRVARDLGVNVPW